MISTRPFIFSLLLIVTTISCNYSENKKKEIESTKESFIDSSATVDSLEPQKMFQGEKIWIKQFQCDGSLYSSKVFVDSHANLFLFIHFEGVLKLDSINTYENYSDKLLLLQFDSNDSLINNQYIGNKRQNLLQIIQYQDSFYPVFTEQPSLNSIDHSIARSMNNNIKYKREEITIYEISANEKVKTYLNFDLDEKKSISTIQFDKNQNLILAGSKDIKLEGGMGECTPFTAITNSIPYIEKRKKDSVIWEFSCSNNCIGSVSDLHIDLENNIWVNFEIDNCDKMPCFNTDKHSSRPEKTFIAKVSEDGNLIFNEEIQEYHSRWLKIQNFQNDKIIIHSNSSCFTHWYVKHSPVITYDLNLNVLWEKCFSDTTNSRFDFEILPQDNQILALGHKRTGAIQPGEKQKDYLDKQRVIILRYDTLGNLKWQKTINEPLRIVNFEKGKKGEYYVTLESDSYLNKRIDYSLTIEGESFNTDKKDNYFLIKYK